jgi:hypothetical protein
VGHEAQAHITEVAHGILESAHAGVASALAAAADAAAGIRAGIDAIAAAALASVQSSVDAVTDRVVGLVDSMHLPDVLRRPVVGLLHSAASIVTSGLSQVIGAIQGALDTGVSLMTEVLTSLGRAAEGLLTVVVTRVESVLNSIVGKLADFIARTIHTLETVVQSVLEPVLDWAERMVGQALEQVGRTAIRALDDNRNRHLETLAASVSPGRASNAEGQIAAIRAIGAEAVQIDQDIVHSFEEATSGSFAAIVQAVAGTVTRAIELLGARVAAALRAVAGVVARDLEGFASIARAFTQAVTALSQWVAGEFTGVLGFVRGLIKDPADALIEFAGNALRRLRSFVSALASALVGAASDIVGVFVAPPSPSYKPPPPPAPTPIEKIVIVILVVLAAIFGPELAPVIFIVLVIVVVVFLLYLLYLFLKWLFKPSPPPPSPKPPCNVTTETVAPSPAPRTRQRVGVGEEVKLTYSGGTATWTTTLGRVSPAVGSTSMFTAPDISIVGTVSASGSCGRVDTIFIVESPTGVNMARVPGSGIRHTINRPDSGIKTLTYLTPDTVNFYNTEFRELDVPASCTGVYTPFNGVGHGPYPFVGMTNIVVSGLGTQSNPATPDNIYSGDPPLFPPFVPGHIIFDIPYEYRVGGGAFMSFRTVRQISELHSDPAQTLTSDKAGAHGDTTVPAPTSTT